MVNRLEALLHDGFVALTSGRIDDAARCCKGALAIDPRCAQAHFLVGLIATERHDPKTAASAFGSVTRIDRQHVAAWAQLARVFVQSGQANRADQALARALEIGSNDPTVLDAIGVVLSQLGDQSGARHHYARAVALRPNHAPFQINLANAQVFLGAMEDAERTIRDALRCDPANPQAHWLLATVRKATDPSHIRELEALIGNAHAAPQAMAFLSYAAGKEYEDLERWDDAFAAFARGAAARRTRVQFDERAEAATFAALKERLTARWLNEGPPGAPDEGPIFVVGQPRTGTTLVERIISSHSQVHSAGELQQFRLSIRRNISVTGSERLSPAIVAAAAAIEPRALGDAYLKATETMRGDTPRFVDKLPTNFLLLPLIAKALPNARIVHLSRDPMDSCFASFKQLFADAYPHSYDQGEMARHFLRYHDLMNVWRERMPGRIIDVSYEALVADIEPHARRLIEALGLPWEDACLDFHRQTHAVTTASAVQVREPAHTRSVGRWRRYATHLAPMHRILAERGLVA